MERRRRIALITYGTRGDVQPFVAIGLALQARGHDVVVAAPENHLPFIEGAGLRGRPLAGDSDAIMASPDGQRFLATGNTVSLLKAFGTLLHRYADDVLRDIRAAIRFPGKGGDDGDDGGDDVNVADLLVCGALVANASRIAADEARIPWVMAHTFPGSPAREFPSGLMPRPRLPSFLNPATARLTGRLGWWWFHAVDDAQRDRLGLPHAAGEAALESFDADIPALHLWSDRLLPRPSTWPSHQYITGFPRLPKVARQGLGEDAAAIALADFLDRGPPPLYVGLGSMPLADPVGFGERVVDVARGLGLRVLLGGRFAQSDQLAATLAADGRVDVQRDVQRDVQICGAVDHDQVFPRCCAVLHHGGAGTTATGLLAGRPTLVCPVMGDQHFWARVVEEQGLGAQLPVLRVMAPGGASRLRRALLRVLDDGVVTRTRALGRAMADDEAAQPAADRAAAALLTV